MSALNCVVVTPESTALDVKAEFVVVPLYDGELGIGVGHSPMIGRLGYGELRIRTDKGVERYYVDGGFVQVDGNVVSVLTNRAIPAKDVDKSVAEEQLAAAMKLPISSSEQEDLRDRQVSQARAQIQVATRD